ncbi:MAG: hypothetical protein ACFB8W_13795 [Elainellaceae cyanobacterium]
MKRLAMVSVLAVLIAPGMVVTASATDRTRLTAQNPEEASVLNLSDRHRDEFEQGLGNQLSGEYREEFYDGLGNR